MKIKRLIPAILALCAASVVFGGCDEKENKEYDELNAKLGLHYSQIVLTVTDSFGKEGTLVSEYVMNFSDGGMAVDYSVERFSELSLDTVSPAKTTLTGEATVSDGKVTYVEGDEVNLDAVVAGTGLEFKEEYFENADLSGIYLKADVKNPSGFMGSELNCTDMKVTASFLEVFYEIRINYTAENGNGVEYVYVFTL